MTAQEKINMLEGEMNANREKMASSNWAAFHFVKTSDAFKAQYPKVAEEYENTVAAQLAAKEQMEEAKKDWSLHLGEWRYEGDIVPLDDAKYKVLIGHTLSADIRPDEDDKYFLLMVSFE